MIGATPETMEKGHAEDRALDDREREEFHLRIRISARGTVNGKAVHADAWHGRGSGLR